MPLVITIFLNIHFQQLTHEVSYAIVPDRLNDLEIISKDSQKNLKVRGQS